MERISCNSLFKHGPCKCSPNFCVHAAYVCVLYRSMGTGLLRMNIHTLCTLSCTAHTVDTSLFTSKCLVLVSKNSSACAQLLYSNKYQRIIQKKQAKTLKMLRYWRKLALTNGCCFAMAVTAS